MHRKWLGIPVVCIITVLLALSIIGGVMAYTTYTAAANVTIKEPITMTLLQFSNNTTGTTPSTSDSVTWSASMYAGESAFATFAVANASGQPVTVTVAVTGSYPDVTLSSTLGGSFVLAGNSSAQDTFTIASDQSAAPSAGYTYTFTFSR